jgi:hypothetical protein
VAPTFKSVPPPAPVVQEPVTRTWQAPPTPTDAWEEPTTLYPSRD